MKRPTWVTVVGVCGIGYDDNGYVNDGVECTGVDNQHSSVNCCGNL